METIPNVIKKKVATFDKNEVFKYENMMISMLTSPILILGAMITFFVRYLYFHEAFFMVFTDSLVLVLVASMIILIIKLRISESRKEDLLNFFTIFVLIYFHIRFFYLISTCVFVLTYLFIMISLLREKLKTILSVAITGLLMIQFVYYYSNNFFEVFLPFQIFAMHSTSVIVFTLIACLIHKMLIDQNNMIRESEQKQFFTLQSVGDGVITVKKDGLIEFINPAAESMTGWQNEEASGQPFETVFRIINEYTQKTEKNPLKEVFETGNIVQLENHTLLIRKDGKKISIEDTAAPIMDNNQNIQGAVIIFKDFSKMKIKQRRIEYLSYHDQLTGLYNRRFFDEELKRLDTKRNLPLSIIYADVNGLKIINDTFGHEKGDWLIQEVANILKESCRSDDIIARTGGDEFVILLPKINEEAAKSLVFRMKEKSDNIIIYGVQVSVSYGWDTKYEENESIMSILNESEKRMYQKKILYSNSRRSDIIKSIHNALLLKLPGEERHAKKVSSYCERIARIFNRDEDNVNELKLAGYMHDIGKIAVDENIINKPERLTESEMNQIKKHPEIGYRLLGASSDFANIAECILAHHERWDGSGYPYGLSGELISWNARVISVVDAYDAMTSDRPYRKALSKEQAISELIENAGTQFDPIIVKAFVEVINANDEVL